MPISFYGRCTMRAIASLMGWRNPCAKIKSLAPVQSLEAIVQLQRVRILHPIANHGDVSTYELYVLNSLVKAFAPRTIFEIGTLHGRTTVNLLDNAEQLDTLYTLDILEELPGNKFQTHPNAGKVKRIVVNSLNLDTEPYRNQVDFVFIDADHTYNAVVNDSQKAFEMLSRGGFLVWHDFTAVVDTKHACHQFMQQHPDRRFVQVEDTTLLVMLPIA